MILSQTQVNPEDAPRLAQLSLPLDAPTLLRDVIVSRLPYRGPLPITEENDRFADALGGVGAEVLVMPITIREKLIALLTDKELLKRMHEVESSPDMLGAYRAWSKTNGR